MSFGLLHLTALSISTPTCEQKDEHIWNVSCNPGTFRHQETGNCECGNVPDTSDEGRAFVGISYCKSLNSTNTDNNLQAVVHISRWAGYYYNKIGMPADLVHDDYFTVTYCWIHHCKRHIHGLKLPLDPNELDSQFCGVKDRTGLACSRCKDSFAVSINLPEFTCADCTNANKAANVVYWIIAEFLPLGILVLIFLLCDIQISGPMNAFLLFANTFDNMSLYGNSAIDFADQGMEKNYEALSTWARYFYSIWNLEFIASFPVFLPLCVSETFTDMDYLATKLIYGSPMLIILIIMCFRSIYRYQHRTYRLRCKAMFTCMQFCHRKIVNFQRRYFNKENVTLNAGFASFFLLTYSKLINVSFLLLATTTLETKNNPTTRLRLDPYTKPFEQCHLRYAIPALIVIFFLIVFPSFVLLCYVVRNRIEFYRRYRSTKLHQLNTHLVSNGPLWVRAVHDFCKYYASGLKRKYYLFGMTLFLYRICSTLIYAFCELEQRYLAHIALAGTYLFLISWLRPYNSTVGIKTVQFSLNTVQSCFLLITILVNAISLWNHYQLLEVLQITNTVLAWYIFQQILIFLPLFYVIFYISLSLSKIKWHVACKQKPSPETKSLERERSLDNVRALTESMTAEDFDYYEIEDRDLEWSLKEMNATQREEAKVERKDWCIPFLKICCHVNPAVNLETLTTTFIDVSAKDPDAKDTNVNAPTRSEW